MNFYSPVSLFILLVVGFCSLPLGLLGGLGVGVPALRIDGVFAAGAEGGPGHRVVQHTRQHVGHSLHQRALQLGPRLTHTWK